MVAYKNLAEIKEKVQECQEQIIALDEERKKIQVFERELPLSLNLVSQAIERYKEQMSATMKESNFNGESDHSCDKLITCDQNPVLEEFIPMKSTNSSTNEDFDVENQQKKHLFHTSVFTGSKDWLASAQLSIQPQDPPLEEELLMSKKMVAMEERVNECGSYKKNLETTVMSSSADTDGGGDGGGGRNGEDKGRRNKKERRCWSPELHRRFLDALQQLGGAHVATPKQIRELMKVNGLTNDEIKSHLQKYRLHTRRLNPTIHNVNDSQSPQLVAVVGRIWMPTLDYSSTVNYNATSVSTTNDHMKNAKTVYAPIASLPVPYLHTKQVNKSRKFG